MCFMLCFSGLTLLLGKTSRYSIRLNRSTLSWMIFCWNGSNSASTQLVVCAELGLVVLRSISGLRTVVVDNVLLTTVKLVNDDDDHVLVTVTDSVELQLTTLMKTANMTTAIPMKFVRRSS